MRRNKIKKFFFAIVAIVGFYYLLSILLMGTGSFTNYYFPSQFSIEDSKRNKNFIKTVLPTKIEITDSIRYSKIRDSLQIYICKKNYYKSYGIFNLFKHKIESEDFICLNINSLNEERLLIRYEDGLINSMGDSNSYRNVVKKGSDIYATIFTVDTIPVVRMEFINLME